MYSLLKETLADENVTKIVERVTNFVKCHQVVTCVGAGAFVLVVWTYAAGGPKDVKQRLFAWINKQAQKIKDERYEEIRRKLLEPMKAQKSLDPELLKENVIRILEVGAGVGTNFKFYPDGSRLVVVDPNPYFKKYFDENMSKFKIKLEDVIIARGEDMDVVKTNSVDAVVVSLVLCSVDDVRAILNQIKRVLVPGGKFYFLEHVREWDTKKYRHRQIIQNVLTWSRLWPFLFEGCCMDRDPLPIIRECEFASVEAEYLYAPIVYKAMNFVSPHLIGAATK
ncbi:Methyltransferase domain [Halocaridina rubra]|uniref:Methyltransferase domain n=1 Tax=Halocaridina rubra TaxID=373956 RepID=A0AAN8X2Q3_HALRR